MGIEKYYVDVSDLSDPQVVYLAEQFSALTGCPIGNIYVDEVYKYMCIVDGKVFVGCNEMTVHRDETTASHINHEYNQCILNHGLELPMEKPVDVSKNEEKFYVAMRYHPPTEDFIYYGTVKEIMEVLFKDEINPDEMKFFEVGQQVEMKISMEPIGGLKKSCISMD